MRKWYLCFIVLFFIVYINRDQWVAKITVVYQLVNCYNVIKVYDAVCVHWDTLEVVSRKTSQGNLITWASNLSNLINLFIYYFSQSKKLGFIDDTFSWYIYSHFINVTFSLFIWHVFHCKGRYLNFPLTHPNTSIIMTFVHCYTGESC